MNDYKIIQNGKDIELKLYQQNMLDKFLNTFVKNNNINTSEISISNMECRKCSKTYFVKNGKFNGIQRYKCKNCNATQSSDVNTPLYKLKLKAKWIDFVYIMLDETEKHTCRNIADKLEINIKTAHQWRHKFIASLKDVNPIELENEVEMDEVQLSFTVKGILGKEKFERFNWNDKTENIPTELRLAELSKIEKKETAFFMCIHNRNSDFDFVPIKIQQRGTVKSTDIENVFEKTGIADKTIITDQGKPMAKYLKKRVDINHLTFNSKDCKKGNLPDKNIHNNHINSVMSHFKDWKKQFHGFSTKYVLNYLKWFRFIKLFKNFVIREIAELSLSNKEASNEYQNTFSTYQKFMYV
ncbi:MAG: IS1595 family transposase [Flavobacteriaceae bacterium]|nr:IS1595 family transposase [Flavobacteriaceae bacterium]